LMNCRLSADRQLGRTAAAKLQQQLS